MRGAGRAAGLRGLLHPGRHRRGNLALHVPDLLLDGD